MAPHCCGVQGRCRVRGRTCVGFLQPPSTAERCILHLPRSSRHPTHIPELPPPGVASHGPCGAAHRSRASRKTRTTTSPDRTLDDVQLQESKVKSRRGCKRPFAFFKTRRPLATNTGAFKKWFREHNAALHRLGHHSSS